MNKKVIIIGTIVTSILIGIVFVYLVFRDKPTTPIGGNVPSTTSDQQPYPSRTLSGEPPIYIPTITLAPKDGKVVLYDVELDDFTPLITKTPDSKIGTIKESFAYKLEYREDTGYFYINFSDVPSENEINQAESDLLQTLGIDQEDACNQSIEVLIPNKNNPSVKDPYSLSFCFFEGDGR